MRDLLFWTDIETTGLDPKTDLVLEVAFGISDEHGNWLSPISTYVLAYEKGIKSKCPAFVREMHTKSGLFDAMEFYGQPAEQFVKSINTRIIADYKNVLEEHGLMEEKPKLRMAGASVHFDKTFLEEQILTDEVKALFTHRVLDVSTLKYLLPEAILENPRRYHYPTHQGTAHRAGADMLSSRAEYKFFRDNWLVPF